VWSRCATILARSGFRRSIEVRRVRWFLVLWLAAIVVGSTYPFDLQLWPFGPVGFGEPLHLLRFNPLWQPLRDVVMNVAFFAPLGYAAAMLARGRRARLGAWLAGLLALAIALQLVQLYLPSRVPSMGDAGLNGLGLLLGALPAVARPLLARRGRLVA
jgi:glycopeptide antibiotics resistance protein